LIANAEAMEVVNQASLFVAVDLVDGQE